MNVMGRKMTMMMLMIGTNIENKQSSQIQETFLKLTNCMIAKQNNFDYFIFGL